MTITPTALDEEDEILTATITEFERIEKCSRCQKKIQHRTTTKVVKCNNCGVINIYKCGLGVLTTVAVKVESGESLSLKMGDEALSKILLYDVIHLYEQS